MNFENDPDFIPRGERPGQNHEEWLANRRPYEEDADSGCESETDERFQQMELIRMMHWRRMDEVLERRMQAVQAAAAAERAERARLERERAIRGFKDALWFPGFCEGHSRLPLQDIRITFSEPGGPRTFTEFWGDLATPLTPRPGTQCIKCELKLDKEFESSMFPVQMEVVRDHTQEKEFLEE